MIEKYIQENFSYNPLSGQLYRGDKPVGHPDSYGYLRVKIKYRHYFCHRIAYLIMTGTFPDKQVDHINGVVADNRWENLRLVDNINNARNQKLAKNNTSGISGVNFNKKSGKWRARISSDSGRPLLYQGYDFFDACCARKSAENRIGYHENHGRKINS